MCIGVNMDKCDFFKIALKEYLFDHNVIELCLNNYSSSITLRPLREGQEDGEVLPSFFCQFKQINNLYTQLKDESEESVSNQFKKMRCKVKDKYLSPIVLTVVINLRFESKGNSPILGYFLAYSSIICGAESVEPSSTHKISISCNV